MKNKNCTIALIIFLLMLNIFLFINNQKTSNQLDKLFIISVQSFRNDLLDIVTMELPSREALDKEHLDIVIAVLNRASVRSQTISLLINQYKIEKFMLDMKQDIMDIYINSKQDTLISESDYDKYLKIREKISKLNSVLSYDKYLNPSLKDIESFKNDINSLYSEYR